MRSMIGRLRAPLIVALTQILPLRLDEFELLGLMLRILLSKVRLVPSTIVKKFGGAGALAAVVTSVAPALAHPLRPMPATAMAEAVEPKTDWLLERAPNPTGIEG
jgi:hypothetical protein